MSEGTVAGRVPGKRLPPGRHGLSRAQVGESQRQRLLAASAKCLAERGYGQITLTEVAKTAGVSTATFYQHFEDLRACLLTAYEAGAERLCRASESACGEAGGNPEERARAGTAAALALLASEPSLSHLLSGEPPPQATALWAARLRLTGRLAALLAAVRGDPPGGKAEPRLIGAALTLVSRRVRAEGAERLGELTPSLTEILLAARSESPRGT